MALTLQGGTVVTLDPPSLEARDLTLPGSAAVTIDARGCLVLPGIVVGHTHLYSALARGMPGPAGPTRSFREVLERVWWRLDQALDEASLRASAELALSEAALAGATCLIDHHESPRFIDGSLDVLAEAAGRIGVRVILCYGATDRHGHADALRGLEECRRFATRVQARGSGLFGAMVGLHACFTAADDTLAAAADLVRSTGLGFHVHAAEDACDQDAIGRLSRFGLLGPRTLVAHAVHVSEADTALLRDSGSFVAHNPRSNMQNAVGQARLGALSGSVALGTDGMDGDAFAELRAAHLTGRIVHGPDGGVDAVAMLAAGRRLAERHLGALEADAVVLEYDSPTPLTPDNLADHLLFGVTSRNVRDVIVAGEPVVLCRRLQRVDATELAARGREQARRLWTKMSG